MNNYKAHITEYFDQVKNVIDKIDSADIEKAIEAFLKCYNENGTLYIFGNGGSGATASHICGDFIKGVSYGMDKRFKFICLNDNISSMLAISNDISYDDVFVEPLKNFLSAKDLVIGISGSGNSTNVVKALEYAKEQNVQTLSLSGFKGGKIKDLTNVAIHVPIDDMEITEDLHMIIFHVIKNGLIKKLKGDKIQYGKQYESRIS